MSRVRTTTGLSPIPSNTALYASNCSSSVGSWSRPIYKNSVRYNPTASPPLFLTPSKSAGVPMFAAKITSCPSFVTDFSVTSLAHSAFWASNLACFSLYSTVVASSGFTRTTPSSPSRIKMSPFFTSSVIELVPTTAGISNERAIIAEWEVRPPIFVAKPLTYFLLSWAVSDGVKSSAITITSSSIKLGFGKSTPKRCAKIRLETSLISAARSFIYSLSIASNIDINISEVSLNAYSALITLDSISVLTVPINSGSSKIKRWASNTAALSAPRLANAFSLIIVNSFLDASIASSKRLISAATSSIFTSLTVKSGSTNT